MEGILRAAPVQFAVCSFVKDKEALSVFTGVDDNGKAKREAIDLQPLVSAGVLDVVVPDWQVISPLIVVLANGGIRGMGEKISGAIAWNKNWAIATDDRHAQRKFAVLMPHTQIITTLDLLHYWALAENVSNDILRNCIEDIQVRGKYTIAPDNVHYAWVMSIIE
jgi:hypothetical protein